MKTTIPNNELQRRRQHERLDNLEAGDTLNGKTITAITHLDEPNGHLGVVTRVHRDTHRGTEFVVHTLNKQTGGLASGFYTTDSEAAADTHKHKVNLR